MEAHRVHQRTTILSIPCLLIVHKRTTFGKTGISYDGQSSLRADVSYFLASRGGDICTQAMDIPTSLLRRHSLTSPKKVCVGGYNPTGHFSENMVVCRLTLRQGNTESRKTTSLCADVSYFLASHGIG